MPADDEFVLQLPDGEGMAAEYLTPSNVDRDIDAVLIIKVSSFWLVVRVKDRSAIYGMASIVRLQKDVTVRDRQVAVQGALIFYPKNYAFTICGQLQNTVAFVREIAFFSADTQG
ncbi:hypothetical protein BDV12DRAFT_175025 [Aspergillus spectabilis]